MKKQIKWMLAAILTICGATGAWAQSGYEYVYRSWDTTNKVVTTEIRTCSSYTAINGSDTSDSGWIGLNNGWYVVTGNSSYKTLNVLGDNVHLIIPDGVTLTLTGGVKLETNHSLSIYGQTNDSGQLTVTNSYSGAAGIGGGEGASCGTLIIHGGTIKATGGSEGAGIGGGKNKGFDGGLTIYGGNVTAQGGESGAGIGSGSENPSNIAGYITIYGGTVKANYTDTGYYGYHGKDGAGIGGGDKGNGAIVSIYGGTVFGYAGMGSDWEQNGAGIGGGRGGNGGETYIYGGTVYARSTSNGAAIGGGNGSGYGGKGNGGKIVIEGGEIDANSYGNYKSTGSAIGCGYKGEAAEITISGGRITAEANGAAIGGGKGYSPELNITISGGTIYGRSDGAVIGSAHGEDFKGSVTITGGSIYATGLYRAIGGDNTEEFASMLTIGPEMKVMAGWNNSNVELFTADLRLPACIYRTYAEITPCDHPNSTYTVSGTSATDTHTKHCAYCTTAFTAETHTFSDGMCTVCGMASSVCTVTIYVPKAETLTDGDYDSPMSYNMVTDEMFYLPPAPNTPSGMEFAGWVVGDVSRTSFITNGSETLLEEESEYTITADITLTARYRYLDISLANDADNSEKLFKYNGKAANSVTLSDRTLYKDGSWNTLCLPFEVSTTSGTLAGNGVKAMTLDTETSGLNGSTLTLNFTEATTIAAGTPFIIKWNEDGTDIMNPVFSGVTVSYAANAATVEGVLTFTGTYAPISIGSDGDNTKLYLGSANTLYWPNAAMNIGCQRAYFQLLGDLTAGEPASGEAPVRAFVLNFGDGEQTGIVSLSKDLGSEGAPATWYTLDGRRLSGKPTVRSIYINNGRKIIIK